MNIMTFIKKSKFFTLIELIVVIVVLGILAAIIVPNISSFKEEAEETAIISDARNIQTAVDMYMLKNNGSTPTKVTPTLGNPQTIELYGLKPNYLRDLPKTDRAKFWLDQNNTVWASLVDAPSTVDYTAGKLTWKTVDGAELYKIYQSDNAVTSSVSNPVGMKFIDEVGGDVEPVKELPALTKGTYLVTAVDKFEFESAPTSVGTKYTEYQQPSKDFVTGFPTAPAQPLEEPKDDSPVSNVTTVPSSNKYFYFEGTTASYIKSPVINNFPSGDFTIDFSTFFTTFSKTDELVFSYATPSEDNEIYLSRNNGYLFYIMQGQDSQGVRTTVPVNENELHHYALTYTAAEKKVKIYKDQQLVFEKVHSDFRPFGTTGIVFIGQDQDSYGGTLQVEQSLNSFLQDLRLWNYELPVSDLEKLEGKSVVGTSPELVINLSANADTQVGTSIFSNVDKVDLNQRAYAEFSGATSSLVAKNVTGFPNGKFTVSFWMNKYKNASSGSAHMFSYATSSTNNNDIILKDLNGKLSIFIRNKEVVTPILLPANKWTHIAASWESATGKLNVYQDGNLAYTTTFSTGVLIGTTGCLVLAQDQDAVCGGYDGTQSFIGTLNHVNVYGSILTPEQIKQDMNLTTPIAPYVQLIPAQETVWDIYYKNKTGVYKGVNSALQ